MIKTRTIQLFFLAIFFGSCATNIELFVTNLGIYQTGGIERVVDNQSLTGFSSTPDAATLRCESHVIYISELQENQFFGFSYYINYFQQNRIKHLKRLGLKLVIRTPVLVNSSGEISTFQTQKLIVLSDFETYNGYAFNESWEKIPGVWSFEFYFKEELIGILHFDLREKLPEKSEERIYSANLDQMANYKGDEQSLDTYLSTEKRKIEPSLPFGTSAQVIVGFIVNQDGSISESTIIKSNRVNLDLEALRIVNNMANWNPAQLNGQAVRSAQAISIIFENK